MAEKENRIILSTQYNDTQYIFLGEIIGGSSIEFGPETVKVEGFNPKRLSILMIPNRKKQINNFLRHKNIVIKDSITVSAFKVSVSKVLLRIFDKMV